MTPRLLFQRCLPGLGACLLWALAAAPSAHAQKQEDGILSKVKQGGSANRESFAFADADKNFGTASAAGSRQARVKSYNFGGKSSIFGGDGTFRTKGFSNPKDGGYRTDGYATKASALSQRNSFAQSDRTFGTKSMDVREAPSANKTLAVKSYTQADTTYTGRGKRQDFLDERTQEAKNLTSDQIRDLLNKGPAAKPGTVLEPVLPSVR